MFIVLSPYFSECRNDMECKESEVCNDSSIGSCVDPCYQDASLYASWINVTGYMDYEDLCYQNQTCIVTNHVPSCECK